MMKHCPGPYLAGYHRVTGTICMIICYWSFFMACYVDPGVIRTKADVKQGKKRYDFDEVMFMKDNSCTTCKFEKPARSKHCAVCDHCVEKFDHHCIWINNCVGRKNYRFFLLFLFMHVIICLYGAVAGWLVFYQQMEAKNNQGLMFYNKETGEQFKPTMWLHFRFFFFNEERHFGVICIICAVMGVVLFFFFGYHFNLAMKNMTTNEEVKRSIENEKLDHQLKTVDSLIKEVNDWEPEPTNYSKAMPRLKVDGVEMPEKKGARIKKFSEFKNKFQKRKKNLNEDTPYQPHPTAWAAIQYIWNE